jgi:hypothetical protein
MALSGNIEDYFDFWDVSNIEIYKVYPDSADVVCDFGNYPDCNVIKVISKESLGVGLSNFVALCRKASYKGEIYDKCELAKVVISYGE